MKIQGRIAKMVVHPTNPVTYTLPIGDERIALNPYLGQKITLIFTQKIRCSACQREIKKSYQDGYCFPCMQKLASCDLCIVRPERCHFHLGTCREPAWGEQHCMIPHWVYLANSSGIKVGITRFTQVPTRWIDQGAAQAVGLFSVATRRISGLVEVAIAKHIPDKTDWRKMLKGVPQAIDLSDLRAEILSKITTEIESIKAEFGEHAVQEITPEVCDFHYPILQYPSKMISLPLINNPK